MFAMFINDYQILVEKEVDPEDDDYSVDAEVIEITEDEDEEEENTEEAKAEEKEEKEEKTVGKKKKK